MFNDERQELEDEYNAQYGDPRRCSVHGCVTSSPDGMFDCPCPECEFECDHPDYLEVDPDWTPPSQVEIDADYEADRAEWHAEDTPF